MLIFRLILLFILDVKGYSQSTNLIYDQRQQVIPNKISPWILLRAKRNFNDTHAHYDEDTDYYSKKKSAIERLYDRQREILNAFQNTSSIPRQSTWISEPPSTIPQGYQYYGECSQSEKKNLVYQHNLGLGLKGSSSQLDANFLVTLDPITITCVEAYHYDNTRGIITWLSGGPGRNYVKLNIKALTNRGVSYTIKIYGVYK